MTSGAAGLADTIVRDHRRLDDLLGQALAAFGSTAPGAAAESMGAFDRELRRHTALEDERLLAQSPGSKLVAPEGETEAERLRRELALEHVQIRELSGILLRLLAGDADREGARRLLPGLMRRWESHAAREERSLHALGAR